MTYCDYWAETISEAARECGLSMTPEQLDCLAKACDVSHDNYGLAFYQPPASDHVNHMEREFQQKLKEKDKEMERYRRNAETAVKQALNQRPDAQISIEECGEVRLYDGRCDRIQ